MIKKKCNECGTLYPLNHAGACKVDGENDWSTACEKHPTLNLAGASSCQMCESEREIGEYKRKEKQWEKERSKLEEEDGEDTSLLIDKDHFCDTNLYLGNRQLFRDLGATRDSGNAQKEV